jgi:uncharacterized protein YbjT (DUF2867 family)
LFTALAARSIRENGTLALPFGTGRISPVAADDVAQVVATILRDPGEHVGKVYELTGSTCNCSDSRAAATGGAPDTLSGTKPSHGNVHS